MHVLDINLERARGQRQQRLRLRRVHPLRLLQCCLELELTLEEEKVAHKLFGVKKLPTRSLWIILSSQIFTSIGSRNAKRLGDAL